MNVTESKPEVEETVETWIHTSTILKWGVISIGTVSIPILLHTLYKVFTVYRRSQYFLFLSAVLISDIILLTTIIYNVSTDFVLSISGNISCPVTAYLATATSCHSNWLFVCMWIQRSIHVSYPMSIVQSGRIWQIIANPRKLIIYTGILSYLSQIWLLVLMRRQYFHNEFGEAHSYCDADLDLISEDQRFYFLLLEFGISFVIPFCITIIADLAVICNTDDDTGFTIVSSETMSSKGFSSSESGSFFKIQSEESIRAMNLRRRKQIRRCLITVTVHGIINLPFYLVQFVPELVGGHYPLYQHPAYLYADTITYFVYLMQFPLKALFVHFLHPNWVRRTG